MPVLSRAFRSAVDLVGRQFDRADDVIGQELRRKKPLVKRPRNVAADAEALCQAALRPIKHLVARKGEAKQACVTIFHRRDILVGQYT